LILLNLPLLLSLIQDWYHDGNYSHGFLVIPISIFLFWRRKSQLVFPAPVSRQGFALFVLGCFGLLFGAAASEFFSTRVSMVVAVTGLAMYYLGTANFRKVWFAFFFLLFMIPLPSTIYYSATLPMQLFATKVTTAVLQITGVPTYREGNLIFLPGYTLEVAEACSGLRSLATLMALAALFGHLTLQGRIRPIILFLSAFPVAIFVNIIRLLFTAYGAYIISPQLAEKFLHELSGILVFIVALASMIILARVLKWEKSNS
jgi:exosortase